MENILELENLNKKVGRFALDKVSFKLEKGYIMGFVGENGAGKTTTLKTIMNVAVKDSGNVKIFGLDNIKYEKEIKDKIGYVSDEKIFYEDISLNAMKNIVAPFYSQWDDKLFYGYIQQFGLNPQDKIKTLSQGNYKKFAITMALSHKPALLILDEPTANLDPVFRNDFLNILRSFVEDGEKSVLFSTHITTDLDKIADYITLIHRGKLVFTSSKEELLESCCLVKGGLDMENYFASKGIKGLTKNAHGVEGLCQNRDMIADIKAFGGFVEKASIEDVMLYTIKDIQERCL